MKAAIARTRGPQNIGTHERCPRARAALPRPKLADVGGLSDQTRGAHRARVAWRGLASCDAGKRPRLASIPGHHKHETGGLSRCARSSASFLKLRLFGWPRWLREAQIGRKGARARREARRPATPSTSPLRARHFQCFLARASVAMVPRPKVRVLQCRLYCARRATRSSGRD